MSLRGLRKIELNRVSAPRPSTVRLLADALGLTGAERDSFCQAAPPRLPPTPATGRPPVPVPGQPSVPVPEQLPGQPPAAQLPADVVGFSGRAVQLRRLTRLLDTPAGRDGAPAAVVISAIAGTAGIGKTALAVHWAHRVRHRFPDGQLHVNLRGFDPVLPMMSPAEAIRRFLDALGVPPGRVPADLDAQAALYRTLLADRRMLILLDNARDGDQVRPLLPGSAGCLVLVTSRDRLAGLVAAHGALPLPLDLLDREEARDLLASRLGWDRLAAEPAAVDEIVDGCCRLPLARGLVAARAGPPPHIPLRALAAELRDSRDRLDALAGDDPTTDVRAVFSWSYRTLSAEAARLFRLLGLHPGPDASAASAASLSGLPPVRCRRPLAELSRAHLIVEHVPGRYTFHDLLRVYASEQAHEAETAALREAALHRVLDHYLHTAFPAALLLNPARDPIAPAPPRPEVTPEPLYTDREAMTWFVVEHAVLIAAVGTAAASGFDVHTWQLAWTLNHFLERRARWHDWAAVQGLALEAARRLGDPTVVAMALRFVALAHTKLDRFDAARGPLSEALGLYHRAGDLVGEAYTHLHLGMGEERRRHFAEALGHARRALDRFQAAGHPVGQALALNNVGWLFAQVGDHAKALAHCERALALQQELGNLDEQAATWDSLGYIHRRLGHEVEAVACYRRALDLQQGIDDRYGEATTLDHLGDVYLEQGRFADARDAWHAALRILGDLDNPDAAPVGAKLAALAAGPAMATGVPHAARVDGARPAR